MFNLKTSYSAYELRKFYRCKSLPYLNQILNPFILTKNTEASGLESVLRVLEIHIELLRT